MVLLRCVVGFLFAALIARPAAAQPDLIPLNVQVIPFLSFAPHFIAQAEGYFEAQGLDVEFTRMESSSLAVPGLLRGELDVIGGSLNAGIINTVIREGAIRMVADKGTLVAAEDTCSVSSFFVSPELLASETLDDPEVVRGLTFNAPDLANYSGYLYDTLLGRFGLTLDEITFVDVENVLLGEALTTGTVDVVRANEPYRSQILTDGTGVEWITAADIFPNFTFAFVAYGDKLLNQMPDVGERFMIAYLQGVRQYNEGKTERNLDILEAALSLDRAVLERACFLSIRDDGVMNTDGLMDFQAWAFARGLTDAEIEVEDVYDPRFIEAANAALDAE
ncbi:MAG: ABC transporter substrate-binding protein [Chloroflexota bacterium]|nr:ABC transporter substrate-binding protein [Chloroflexota bacterium]